MKRIIHIAFYSFLFLLQLNISGQSTSPAPYCTVNYSQGQCNQTGPSNSPGNFINDFIDDFITTGANTNIANVSSGCNGGPGNYMNYCSHYMAVTPGQTIVCTLKSGITFAQGFAIFIDWNQDNTFNVPSELVAATVGFPPAATSTTISFVIPPTQPNGIYRLRVRCQFATSGSSIPPCGGGSYGEAEDYTVYVGPVPPNSATPTGTALVNTPICVGQALSFSLNTTYSSALSYTWTGPNSYSSTLQNPTIFNATTTATGIYTVLITNSLCPITRTVSARVVAYPVYTPFSNPNVICQGGAFVAGINSNLSPVQYSALWASTAPGNIFNPIPTAGNPPVFSTSIMPALLPLTVPVATYVYSVTISPTVNPACAVTQTISVTINNPLTPTLTMPQPLCNTFAAVQLTAAPVGGTWGGNAAVSASGLFNPSTGTIGVNNVSYSVAAGNCIVSNSATLSVSKFHTPALSSGITLACVQDPLFNLMHIVQDTLTGFWSGTQVNNNYFNPAGLPSGSYSFTYHTFSTPISSVCPSTTVLTIPVFNPPVPVISPIPPVCDNTGTVALTANPPNGVWSGNSGVSNIGIRTPSLNTIGTNTVFYTAGQGTCVASTSKTFHVSHFNTAAFSGTVPNLCARTANPFNLMSIVQNTNGTWYDPQHNINVSPTSIFSANTLTTSIYALTYTAFSSPDPNLCPATNSISVYVLNPPTPSIFQVGPYCSTNGPVQLSAVPPIGHWVTTTYLASNGAFTPSLGIIGDNYVQYVIGTNTCNTSNTKIIKVESFVSAEITSRIGDQCNTNPPIDLLPFTLNNTGTWTGMGISGTSFNPALNGSGHFILTYHTASMPSGLCPDQATVAVQVFSLAPPSIVKTGTICNNALPFKLQVSPVGGIFDGGVPGLIDYSGLFNPAMGAEGDNFINYSISVGPCKSHAQAKISIEKFVSADLEKLPDPVYCKNRFPFNLNSFAINPGGDWQGDAVTNGMFDPSVAAPGENKIIYRTHSTSPLLCPDENTVTIFVKDLPNVKATTSSIGECAPLQISLNLPGTNFGNAVWNITDGTRYEGLSANPVLTHPGSYTVVMTYADEEAKTCTIQVVLPTIVVKESPKADFYLPTEITLGDPIVTISNQSTVFNKNKYEWNIQGQQDPVYEVNPKVKFAQPGNYRVTLTATNLEGCKDEMTKIIEVKNDFNIHIPNSFTPNFDGLNDIFIPVFTPYGLDTKTFDLEIFDRWGHQVYHTKDLNKGWDGTVSGGELAKEDTYVYRIRYKDLDGRVYNKTGHLSLLRN